MKCALSWMALCLAVARVSSTSPVDNRRFGAQLILEDGYGAEPEKKMTVFELPQHLRPVRYELHVEPNLEKATFEGHVKITVKAITSTASIKLNAKYIKLAAGTEPVVVTRINRSTPEKIRVESTHFDEVNEQLVIHLGKPVSPKADYLVEIHYSGILGDDMMGFYLSRYTLAGKEKLLASTQFEPTGARRAFPCFDEPQYKTPFTIKVTRDKVQKSISNLPLKTSVPVANSNKEIDTFLESPNMPTYLVAFAVFEFDSISNEKGTFRVWGREDIIKKQGQYIFEKGQKILTALSNYMGIDYYSMLPKIDLVAVPDFDAGAMENWGMNTYREILIFADTTRTKTARQEDAVSTVTHEFSHQWFGDLVTPSKWDFVWLNEAFATYFEYMITAVVEPTWRMEDLFVVEQVQVAFQRDQIKDSHAMTSKTTTPQSIADTFDHIIYNKGGSVLRMIENAVTPEIFKQSLRLYLKTGSSDLEGTVEPANLWDAFDESIASAKASVLPEGGTTITEFVDEWTNNPGFPLVTITRNYSSNFATLTQRRFLKKKKTDEPEDKSRWTVPITYTTKAGGGANSNQVWFPKNKQSLTISLPNNQDWFIANVKQVGFYRVNYDDTNWGLLVAQLNEDPSKIHVLNRAQILDDAFSLAEAGQLKLQTALELAHYLQKETDFIPWYAVYGHLNHYVRLYAGTELGNQMKTYLISRMDGIFKVLGLDDKANEENMSKIGRSSIAAWICELGHHGCTNEAAHKFRDWIQTPDAFNIGPNIKSAVYCTGIRLGTKEQWTALWNYYLKSDLASEKVAVLQALGCSQDEELLYTLLGKLTGKSKEVRAQDHYILIGAVIGERAGVKAALRFLKDQGAALLKEAKENERSPAGDNLKSIVSRVGSSVRNKEELTEFTTIIAPIKEDPTVFSYINKTLEHTAERFQFKATHEAALTSWFAAHTPSTSPSPITSTPARRTTPPEKKDSPSPSPDASTTPKPNSGAFSLVASFWLPLASLLLYAMW